MCESTGACKSSQLSDTSPGTLSKQAVYLLQVKQEQELKNLDDGQQGREEDSKPLERKGKKKKIESRLVLKTKI